MTAIQAACFSKEFTAGHDRTISTVTNAVYVALEAQVYHRERESPNLRPESKDTTSLIDEFLAEYISKNARL